MITPRFADTIDPQPRPQAPPRRELPQVAYLGAPNWGESSSQVEAQALSREFKYWAYICIHRISNAFAEKFPGIGYKTARAGRGYLSRQQTDWLKQRYGRHWVQSIDDDLEPVPETHPLYQLLQRVNDTDTFAEFAYETSLFLHLTGKVYWWAVPNALRGANGLPMPAELWVIPTQWVREVYSQSGRLTSYKIIPDTVASFRELEVPPEEIIVGKFKNPRSKIEGFAPLMAGAMWADNSEDIEKSRHTSFKSGVNPDLILSLGPTYKDPSADILTRIKERFIARVSGVNRSGEPLIIPPDITAEKWTNVPKEMAFPESANQMRDNVLALFGVPPVIAGLSVDYNRATAEAATLVFCEQVMNPLFRLMAGIMTEKLAARFDPTLRCWYDDCRPADAQFRLLQQQFAAANGAWTPDDTRDEMGKEPFNKPWSQTPYIAMGMRPLAEEARDELEPEEPTNPPPGKGKGGDNADKNSDGEDQNQGVASRNGRLWVR